MQPDIFTRFAPEYVADARSYNPLLLTKQSRYKAALFNNLD